MAPYSEVPIWIDRIRSSATGSAATASKRPKPLSLVDNIAATLPADPDSREYRTLDEIKYLLKTHCQPCDKFTGNGCRDFSEQGLPCYQRNRFIQRLKVPFFGCERWKKE